MTNDLVKRLRTETNGDLGRLDAGSRWGMMIVEAADHIEALEKEVEDWKQRCVSSVITLITSMASTSTEKANIRAIFENPEELLAETNDDQ